MQAHTRAKMDARFGHDFSSVRIHADNTAGQIARSAGANALTFGNDVFFGSGRYTPGNRNSDRLLSHELAHVVQQEKSGPGDPTRLSRRDDPSEREAEKAADSVAAGGQVQINATPDAAIARDEDESSNQPFPTRPQYLRPYANPIMYNENSLAESGSGSDAKPAGGNDPSWADQVANNPYWNAVTNNAVSLGTSMGEEAATDRTPVNEYLDQSEAERSVFELDAEAAGAQASLPAAAPNRSDGWRDNYLKPQDSWAPKQEFDPVANAEYLRKYDESLSPEAKAMSAQTAAESAANPPHSEEWWNAYLRREPQQNLAPSAEPAEPVELGGSWLAQRRADYAAMEKEHLEPVMQQSPPRNPPRPADSVPVDSMGNEVPGAPAASSVAQGPPGAAPPSPAEFSPYVSHAPGTPYTDSLAQGPIAPGPSTPEADINGMISEELSGTGDRPPLNPEHLGADPLDPSGFGTAAKAGTGVEQEVTTGSRIMGGLGKGFGIANKFVLNPLGVVSNGLAFYEDAKAGNKVDATMDAVGFTGSSLSTALAFGAELGPLAPWVAAGAGGLAGGYAIGQLLLAAGYNPESVNNYYNPLKAGDDPSMMEADPDELSERRDRALNGDVEEVRGIDIGTAMDKTDAQETARELYSSHGSSSREEMPPLPQDELKK